MDYLELNKPLTDEELQKIILRLDPFQRDHTRKVISYDNFEQLNWIENEK